MAGKYLEISGLLLLQDSWASFKHVWRIIPDLIMDWIESLTPCRYAGARGFPLAPGVPLSHIQVSGTLRSVQCVFSQEA